MLVCVCGVRGSGFQTPTLSTGRTATALLNREHVVRQAELVSLDGAVSKPGKGANKRWTSTALLRNAFGRADHTAMGSKSTGVFSANAWAYWFYSSPSFIQRARAA